MPEGLSDRRFAVLTLHRPADVDSPSKLAGILNSDLCHSCHALVTHTRRLVLLCGVRPDAAVPEPRGPLGVGGSTDHIRKFHTRSPPRIGGISIFIAYLVSFAILLLSPFQFGNIVRSHLDVVRNLFPAAPIVFFTGLLDELLGLKAWQKFAAQFAASAEINFLGTILLWQTFVGKS